MSALTLGFTVQQLLSAYESLRDSVVCTSLLRIRNVDSWEVNPGLIVIGQDPTASQWEVFCISPHPLAIHLMPLFIVMQNFWKDLFFYDFTDCSPRSPYVLTCPLPSPAPLLCGTVFLSTQRCFNDVYASASPRGPVP